MSSQNTDIKEIPYAVRNLAPVDAPVVKIGGIPCKPFDLAEAVEGTRRQRAAEREEALENARAIWSLKVTKL